MTTRFKLKRSDGKIYLERWGIEHDRVGGIFVHRMAAPDPGVDLHDHPWTFWSLILKGGYVEERTNASIASYVARWAQDQHSTRRGIRFRRTPGTITRTHIGQAHRIVELSGKTSWSLVVHGPRQRSWGFFTPDRYISHDEYDFSGRRNLIDAI